MRLTGKRAIMTGGRSGIARNLAAEWAHGYVPDIAAARLLHSGKAKVLSGVMMEVNIGRC